MAKNYLQISQKIVLLRHKYQGVQMAIVSLKCKNCGSMMSIDMDSKTVHCSHCASTFLLGELLDKKDIDMISKLKPNELSEKMEAADEIKKGDSRLYAGDFKTAEKHYKRAIALDDNNFRSYLGVVKAKTKNFNIIPVEDDYAEYAKLATMHVDKENSTYLKNELVKIELLKKEKKHQQEIASKKQKQSFEKAQKRKHITNVVLCLVLICVIVGAAIALPLLLKKDPPAPPAKAKTISISTADDLLSFKQTEENLSANIVLLNDIDFSNQTIVSIGTKNKPFVGTFSGNGFTISNLKIKDSNLPNENSIGLFGYAKNATIKNVKFNNVYVSENRNASVFNHNIIGLVCGTAENLTLENIDVSNTCQIHYSLENHGTYSIGGLLGTAKNVSITNCHSHAELSTNLQNISLGFGMANPLTYYIGGLVGHAETVNISKCSSASEISSEIVCFDSTFAESFVAGLIGLANDSSSTISKSYFEGTISANKTAQSSNNYALLSNFKTSIEFETCFALLHDNILENSTAVLAIKISDHQLESLTIANSKSELLTLIETHLK